MVPFSSDRARVIFLSLIDRQPMNLRDDAKAAADVFNEVKTHYEKQIQQLENEIDEMQTASQSLVEILNDLRKIKNFLTEKGATQ